MISHLYIDARGDVPTMLLKGKVISLRALEMLTPNTLGLLEQLCDPQCAGQVFRVEHDGDVVRLKRMGVVAHALNAVGKR